MVVGVLDASLPPEDEQLVAVMDLVVVAVSISMELKAAAAAATGKPSPLTH